MEKVVNGACSKYKSNYLNIRKRVNSILVKKLKIYFGDLTYDTVAISTEAMPLNIGYIAAYSKKKFGDQIEFSLFKYIDELENAILTNPPDLMGLSNYCWSQNVSQEMFKLFSQVNPDGLRIWGGPNFPLDLPSQNKFFDENKDFDIYVPVEGEIGFSNVIQKALTANSKKNIRETTLSGPIGDCILRGIDGKLHYSFEQHRIQKLDEIPSPYTTGILDKFFDGKLVPMLQTNRGCPFSCTFCTDGRDEVRQVNKFSPERIRSDIEYITKKVPSITHSLFISDLNFGMLPGDMETCDVIAEMQEKFNYPHKIIATTGKNNKERIIESIRKLNGSTVLSMSVQSLDENVLKNIKRDNISTEKMLQLAPVIKEYNLNTIAEVILNLPGESYNSHQDTIRKLINANLDDIVIHTCMLLPGSEMGTPEQRNFWKFNTKYRILPRDFATLRNGKRVCEIEEVIVSSKDMTFEEYVKLRLTGFTLWMTNKGILYDPLLKYLKEKGIDRSDLFFQMVERKETAPNKIIEMYEKFKNSTINELMDSPKEIFRKIQDNEFYQNLVEGKAGINVMQYHHAEVLLTCMEEWTDYVLKIAYQILEEYKKLDEKTKEEFETIHNYCKGCSHNPLGDNRLYTNPEYDLNYNIIGWLADKSNNTLLSDYKLRKPKKYAFMLTDEDFKVIDDTRKMYGNSLVSWTKTLKMVPQQVLWRKPKTIDLE